MASRKRFNDGIYKKICTTILFLNVVTDYLKVKPDCFC